MGSAPWLGTGSAACVLSWWPGGGTGTGSSAVGWLARKVPALMLKIELLVVPGCPNEDAAAELIATAVADTGVTATVTCTVIVAEAAAEQRGFIGSPTILLNGRDPSPVP